MTACRGLLILNLFEEIQQGIYFLWRLRSFGASRQIILVFLNCNSECLAVLQHCLVVFSSIFET